MIKFKIKLITEKVANKCNSSKREILSFLMGIFVTALFTIFTNSLNTYLEYKYFLNAPKPFSIEQSSKYYPMKVGNYWAYSGKIEMQTVESGTEVLSNDFNNYRFTISDIIKNNDFLIAKVLVENNPVHILESGDYSSSNELWIMEAGEFYKIDEPAKVGQYWEEFKSQHFYITDFSFDSIEWTFPLYVGKKFRRDFTLRGDGFYSYNIIEKTRIKSSVFNSEEECFKRVYKTMPDHQDTWFCPGIGIVESYYSHHGSVMNLHLQLSEYFIK